MAKYLFIIFLLAAVGAIVTSGEPNLPFNGYYCLIRCASNCIQERKPSTLDECKQSCQHYNNDSLCTDNQCWLKCDDLTPILTRPDTPTDLSVRRLGYRSAKIEWTAVADAQLYVVRAIRLGGDKLDDGHSTVLTETPDHTFLWRRDNKTELCVAFSISVAAVSINGVSLFTTPTTLPEPAPSLAKNARKLTVKYSRLVTPKNKTVMPFVEVEFEYVPPNAWDIKDLQLEVQLQTMTCEKITNLPQKPPQWNASLSTPVFHVRYPVAQMHADCQQLVLVQAYRSRRCGTRSPLVGAHMVVNLTCNAVSNSGCGTTTTVRLPQCGQLTNVSQSLVDDGSQNGTVKSPNVTVRLEWDDASWLRDTGIIQYSVSWGVLGSDDNGTVFLSTRIDQQTSLGRSVLLPELRPGVRYGVLVCAIYDRNNAELPSSSSVHLQEVYIENPSDPAIRTKPESRHCGCYPFSEHRRVRFASK